MRQHRQALRGELQQKAGDWFDMSSSLKLFDEDLREIALQDCRPKFGRRLPIRGLTLEVVPRRPIQWLATRADRGAVTPSREPMSEAADPYLRPSQA
jgi:hypothetical protein